MEYIDSREDYILAKISFEQVFKEVLDIEERFVIGWRLIGWKFEEIGERLSLSPSGIKRIEDRAVMKMRKHLTGE